MNGWFRVSCLSLIVMGFGLLSATELEGQLECGYCLEEGDQHIFISYVNCEPSIAGARGEGECKVCIGSSLLGGDDCDYNQWKEGPCPRFDCGVGSAAIASLTKALKQRDFESVAAVIRRSLHITLQADSPAISILGCTGNRSLHLQIPREMASHLRALLSFAAEENQPARRQASGVW